MRQMNMSLLVVTGNGQDFIYKFKVSEDINQNDHLINYC